jgi:hypothetical protein
MISLTKTKAPIVWDGPSAAELLALVEEKQDKTNGITISTNSSKDNSCNTVTNNGNTNFPITTITYTNTTQPQPSVEIENPIVGTNSTEPAIEVNISTEEKNDAVLVPVDNTPAGIQGKSNVHFRLIRQYLYDLLKDKDCAFFKISQMTQDLGINPKTIFKHLKVLRQSEFEIKREQFGTIIKKRLSQ